MERSCCPDPATRSPSPGPDVDPGLFARFPLVARPRPICGPLRDRVAGLTARAKAATTSGSLTEASAVYNLAALIASDCGLPDLARQWCLDHADAYLRAPHPGAQVGRNVLEPVVNLARLHIRANDGESAYQLLTDLFQAVTDKTDIDVDGLVIPASIINDDDEHQAVRQWLWTVLLSDGTRALTSAGRWTEAHRQLHAYNGVGVLMLDGRQVAVIAHAQAGDLETAQRLIATTAPGDQPWLDAVTACLAVLCQDHPSPDLITDMMQRYERLSVSPDIVVFGVRLGLTVLGAAGAHQAVAASLAARLVDQTLTAGDGYATRDLLAHPDVAALLNEEQRAAFDAIGEASSLNAKHIPGHLRDEIGAALAESRAVLARHT